MRRIDPKMLLFALPIALMLAEAPYGFAHNAIAQAVKRPAVSTAVNTVRYNRDIRPILAENCFVCHGPDSNKRMAGLRLDQRDAALAGGVLAPGKPAQSKLVARIFAAPGKGIMPPEGTHHQLTTAQKATLKTWIAQGAPYEAHWAFVPPPKQVPLPPVQQTAWCRDPLDRFVLARLEQAHLHPSPDASRADWLRRVTLDLTGIAPTLQETSAFLTDKSPRAFETVVDRLLASPRYGERMATPWLDAARYADSYGYQSDQLCPTWPYRDWVVQAFNKNLSYDRFLTEQLAGDLLPNITTPSSKVNIQLGLYSPGANIPDKSTLLANSKAKQIAQPFRQWDNPKLPGIGAGGRGLHRLTVTGIDPLSESLAVGRGVFTSPTATWDDDRHARLATAFNRIHRMTNEGGSVPEEWRMEGVADRVRTFGTAVLGLTLECARCHDHKYDPITQKDYYAFSAFFNSIDEYGMYDRADIVPSPSLLLPTPEQEQNLKAAVATATQREQERSQALTQAESTFQTWLAQLKTPSKIEMPDMTGRFEFAGMTGSALPAALPNLVPGAKEQGSKSDNVPLVEGRIVGRNSGKAPQLDGENNLNFPALGRFTRHTPYTIAFWMWDPRQVEGGAVVYSATDGTDAGPHGYDLMVDAGRFTARMFRHWPGNAIAVRTKSTVQKETWTHVAVTYDGSSRAAGLKIYLDGKPADIEIVRDHMVKGTGQHTLVFGQRFRDKGLKGGKIDEVTLFNRDVSPLEVAQLCDGHSLADALAKPQTHLPELRAYYLSALDPQVRTATQTLQDARMAVWAAEDPQYEIAVMEEMPQPRPAYVLARGRYDAPQTDAQRVGRTTPASLPPFPADLPRDRYGLAQWLTRTDHPLTARVAVNRFWSLLFGRGLVETTEDFGIQGRPPTHPELLDRLARNFVDSGWNVKALVRRIVLSSTYRQASALRPDLRERDPLNLLLARGPSHRLSAEAIRDTALAAAGLLDDRMGGPPVSPYQPGDLWRESNSMSPGYRQSVGGDLYRRSLYTVWKRTAPMPNMTVFDAGSREVCIARRQTTNTPLQALVLLNDTQFVEAARAIGTRMLREGGATDAARVRFLFRLLATREPTAIEQRLLQELYAQQRALFDKDATGAGKLIHIGESKPDATLPASDLAAATVLAQTVLNLDATVWER